VRWGITENYCHAAAIQSAGLPLLFPHDELGWRLAVQYQGDVTSHKKEQFLVMVLPHTDSTSRPMGTLC